MQTKYKLACSIERNSVKEWKGYPKADNNTY